MARISVGCTVLMLAVVAGPGVAAERQATPAWGGWHLGLAIGGRAAGVPSTTTTAAGAGGTVVPDPESALARFDNVAGRFGAYLGYDWQIARTWVGGVEGDFGWARSRKSMIGLPGSYGNPGGFAVNPSSDDGVDFNASWDGSLRGRLGFLATPALLVYGTGGVAWQRVKMTVECGGLCVNTVGIAAATDVQSTTRTGWTVGGGIEAMVAPNWLARAEYRYADFGTWKATWHASPTVYAAADVAITTHTALFGLAYKFGAASSPEASDPYASAAPAPIVSWTGLYVGGAIGGRSSDAKWTTTSVNETSGTLFLEEESKFAIFNGNSARFGGYVGLNWQFAPKWLAGIEADFGSANQTRSVFGIAGTFGPIGGNVAQSGEFTALRTTWDGSLRGRFGYLVTPSLLAFATTGPAWMRVERTMSCVRTCTVSIGTLPASTISESTTRLGWTIGGGIEAALAGNWLVRGEYRYADFGTWANSWSFDPTFSGTADVRIRTHTAQLGLAYKFGGGGLMH